LRGTAGRRVRVRNRPPKSALRRAYWRTSGGRDSVKPAVDSCRGRAARVARGARQGRAAPARLRPGAPSGGGAGSEAYHREHGPEELDRPPGRKEAVTRSR